MFQLFLKSFHQILDVAVEKLDKCFKKHFGLAKTNLSLGTFTDLARSKSSLVAENALLRQQLIVLQRQVNKPKLRPIDRLGLVILASLVKNWRQALLIVKPETLLKWHRASFKLFWKFKSRSKGRKPQNSAGNTSADKKDGSRKPVLGCRKNSG